MKIPKNFEEEAKNSYGGFGAAMLSKMGWSKGHGLGKELQGMHEHIKVVKKDDVKGIGEDNTYAWKEKWWEKVYDSSSKLDALAALENGSDDEPKKKKKKKKKPKKKGKGAVESSDSDSDSSSDSSDSSDSDSDDDIGRDGIRSTATKAERKIAKQLAKDPWGRWGGREGKFERIRSYEKNVDTYLPDCTKKSKEEEAEKNGKQNLKPKKKEPAAETEPKKKKKKTKESSPKDDAPAEESAVEPMKGFICYAAQNAKLNGEAAQKKRGEDTLAPVWTPSLWGEVNKGPGVGMLPRSEKEWWGSKMFVSAGCMVGREEEEEECNKEADQEKVGYTEADQENLFNLTHNGKTSGKQGLGQRSKNKLGMDYKGTKVVLGGDDSDGEKAQAAKAAKAPARTEAIGRLDAVKWKKIIKCQLEGAPKGQLKLKKLMKQVLAIVATDTETGADDSTLKETFQQKLDSSSQFAVLDGVVSLAPEESDAPTKKKAKKSESAAEESNTPKKKKLKNSKA